MSPQKGITFRPHKGPIVLLNHILYQLRTVRRRLLSGVEGSCPQIPGEVADGVCRVIHPDMLVYVIWSHKAVRKHLHTPISHRLRLSLALTQAKK